jgi:DNA-binding beta-propeller fold protein YncE
MRPSRRMSIAPAVRLLLVASLAAPAAWVAGPRAVWAAASVPGLTGIVVVVNQRSDSITLVDLATMEAYAHVPVVGGPHEAAVSPDGRAVAVTNYHRERVPQKALSLVELPSGRPLRTIELSPYRMPHDIRWVDSTRVVCTVEADSALLVVNVRSGEIERVFRTGQRGSHMLALSTDRKRLYSSNMGNGSVTAFDFVTGAKLADITTGNECEGVGVSPDGRWVWAGNRAEDTISILDTHSLKVVKRLDSPGFPYRVQFTRDGRYALVPHARASSLVVADVAGQKLLKSIPLGRTQVEAPSTAGVFPHPSGKWAFVTVRNDDSMLVLDLVNGTTLARVAVQSSPDGVSWSPVSR